MDTTLFEKLPFLKVLCEGINDKLDILPTDGPIPKSEIPKHTLPIGLPPIIPSLKEQLEDYLSHPEKLSLYDYHKAQRLIPRKANPSSLFHVELSPLQSTIGFDRDPKTGKFRGFTEEFFRDSGITSKNSFSLSRPPGPPEQGVKGSSTNFPFWPGGLDEPIIEKLNLAENLELVDLENDLLSVPPGFEKGIEFEKNDVSFYLKKSVDNSLLNVSDLINEEDEIDIGEVKNGSEIISETTVEEGNSTSTVTEKKEKSKELDDVLKISQVPHGIIQAKEIEESTKGFEWAVKVDIKSPVDDFYKRIPNMAHQWPFELDIFQKQAILHLEAHDNVFVAAHTSAGKTVVAEYAIALSMRHMTKTIYTSPIKALSNQKFRDFKNTFGDVGLITGDVQLSQEAPCLIMTTEILRSMLYKGSDVIRDLEWVIFDEVHYMNDPERGVVWEEIFIMLPHHVNLILLSATIPNTMEFADWVGRTKKRKVYVVSTTKRPVPLEHFVYTGNSTKTINELFKVVDCDKRFLVHGYNKAAAAKKERSSKFSQGYGAKGTRSGDPKQDKNVWLSVIEMLRKKEQLPVISFIFSRKRIDDNATLLSSVDLTTENEKSKIHMFFQQCISRLKGTDRKLPQVVEMYSLLKRGVGIHHSGVLPILKEVVEMLFQQGFVKVLFATETFAMGVNMPARTVVFDNISKHDGKCFRNLLSGEYIQMAGRAGRRGLDTTGTCIILAKGDLPERSELEKMMLGKPTPLESQFRLTYAMILNLLRVQQLRVEDMMKRSFYEFDNQKDMSKHKETLTKLTQTLEEMPVVNDTSGDLETFYKICDDYYKLKLEIQDVLLNHPPYVKSLNPGRLVIIDNEKYENNLGVILKSTITAKDRHCDILLLCETQSKAKVKQDYWSETAEIEETIQEDYTLPKPIIDKQLYLPNSNQGHSIVHLPIKDISEVSVKSLKIENEQIFEDCKKREIPRFKEDPPRQCTAQCIQDLRRTIEANIDGIQVIDLIKDKNIRDFDLVDKILKLKSLKSSCKDFKCIHDPCFKENFASVKKFMKLKEEHQRYKYLLSEDSLLLIPEYQEKIALLRELNFIDKNDIVQLKGRVACEISSNELIVTELVFKNILSNFQPAEIASVLSCLVFDQRNYSEPKLSKNLQDARSKFLTIAKQLNMEEDFKFGLMEVAYEWARGLPFNEITELTDIQEGIIVRAIQRLDEVLKDVRNAAVVIGDPVLKSKMEEASTLIKRDIVFAASLYTQ